MKRLLLLSLAVMAFQAFGQPYPTKAVRVIVPYPPGGGNDTLGRLFAAKLAIGLGSPSSSRTVPAPAP